MNINSHMKKIETLEKNASKLSSEDDHEVLVEVYMLISAHYINAALHHLGVMGQSKDIKHNQIFSFLKDSDKLGKDTVIISECMKKLDDLRPSHVYGKGENGKTAEKARAYCNRIRECCAKLMGAEKSEG